MAFRFRQFTIEDEQSTQRVGTDSMLLGSWSSPGKTGKILDIGTGCGVLALMMAQKTEAMIDAIDADYLSINEARVNFARSPWPCRLMAQHVSLQSFAAIAPPSYDFIISNPPYFANSLKSPSARKNIARHDQTLTHEELIRSVCHLLKPDGVLSLILPVETAEEFICLCEKNGLHLFRRINIHPKPGTPAIRSLMEFTKYRAPVETGLKPVSTIPGPGIAGEPGLSIRLSSGAFSPAYLELTHPFHQF